MPDFKKELALKADDFKLIIGCDEVGRGCLAGPVVAAAVSFDWENINQIRTLARSVRIADSKTLSPLSREEADKAIREVAVHIGLGIVSVTVIDEINILQASLRAMNDAVQGGLKAGFGAENKIMILVDGNRQVPDFGMPQETVIGGDAKIFSIAAASIIAKVYRDKLMTELHKEYPVYGWWQNKGYGTLAHRKALAEYGLTPHHRKTFCHV